MTMPTLNLPTADGQIAPYTTRPPVNFPKATPPFSRVAYAAAHVVPDPLADTDPWVTPVIDWDRTIAFRRYLWSLGLGVAEACERLYQRVPVTEANFFGIVIAIQQKSGGNLAETLQNFSRVIRERRKMAGKIKAMSAEAKASAAIIACLPFSVAILVYFSSPDYISLLWKTFHGKITLLLAGFWMVVGVLVMRKMINFDF